VSIPQCQVPLILRLSFLSSVLLLHPFNSSCSNKTTDWFLLPSYHPTPPPQSQSPPSESTPSSTFLTLTIPLDSDARNTLIMIHPASMHRQMGSPYHVPRVRTLRMAVRVGDVTHPKPFLTDVSASGFLSPYNFSNDSHSGFGQSQRNSPLPLSIDTTRSSLSPLMTILDDISHGDDSSTSSNPSLPGLSDETHGVPTDWTSSHSDGTDPRTENTRGRRQVHSAPATRTHSNEIHAHRSYPSHPHSTSGHDHPPTPEDFMVFVDESMFCDENDGSGVVGGNTYTGQADFSLRNFGPPVVPPLSAHSDESHQFVPFQGDFVGELGSLFLSSPEPQFALLMPPDNGSENQFVQHHNNSDMGSSWPFGEPNSPNNEDHGSPSPLNTHGYGECNSDNENHSLSSSSSTHGYGAHFMNDNLDHGSPSPSPSSLHGYGEHHSNFDANAHPSRGRRHNRSLSGSSGSPTSRAYSPYLRPDELTGMPSSPVKQTNGFLTVPERDFTNGGGHRRSHSDVERSTNCDSTSLSRRTSDPSAGRRPQKRNPAGLAAQPTAHHMYGVGLLGHGGMGSPGPSNSAGVDWDPTNSGGVGTMAPQSLPSHQSGGQGSVVKPKVASDAIVTASKSRRTKEARFSCPIPNCIATFTANHNLKSTLSLFTPWIG